MQTRSKKVTKGGSITIPRGMRQESGILPGVPVDVMADDAGIHIVKHVPACFHCGNVEGVKVACNMEICQKCAEEIAEVFKNG